MSVTIEFAIEKSPNFKLKKWVKILVAELDENEIESLEIDWRNNTCLRSILLKHIDKASDIIENY